MKVCTITCNNAENYGARLQTYALAEFLTQSGHEVQVIDYEPAYVKFRTSQWYFPGTDIKEWVKLFAYYSRRKSAIAKHCRLEEFSKKHIPLTPVKYDSADSLRTQPPAADVYIAGSDQIWNTLFPNGKDPAYYLDFGDSSTRRISYAASFAIDTIAPEYTPQVKRNLQRLDAISVRESSAVKIVNNLGLEATQVCDPAFLLDAASWDKIADGEGSGERYLLIYDFESSHAIKDVAQRIARLRGLKIYSVSPLSLGYAHRNYNDCTPATFLSLIKNADCVVSNSLHGSIFSMIYRRDFFIVNRGDGLNARMADLTERYGLECQIVDTATPDTVLTAHIDYSTIIPALDADISKSKLWLLNTLTPTPNR